MKQSKIEKVAKILTSTKIDREKKLKGSKWENVKKANIPESKRETGEILRQTDSDTDWQTKWYKKQPEKSSKIPFQNWQIISRINLHKKRDEKKSKPIFQSNLDLINQTFHSGNPLMIPNKQTETLYSNIEFYISSFSLLFISTYASMSHISKFNRNLLFCSCVSNIFYISLSLLPHLTFYSASCCWYIRQIQLFSNDALYQNVKQTGKFIYKIFFVLVNSKHKLCWKKQKQNKLKKPNLTPQILILYEFVKNPKSLDRFRTLTKGIQKTWGILVFLIHRALSPNHSKFHTLDTHPAFWFF